MQNTTTQRTQPKTGSFQSSSDQRNGKSTNSTSRSKGKSRFAQKSRGNPKKPVAVKRGPVNVYTSVCCGLPATKPACVKVDKKKALEQGMGSWRCSGCHKACKVTVSKFHIAEATVGNVTVTAMVPAEVPLG